MIEAIVSFSLIGLGLCAWVVARLARRFYRQRPPNTMAPGDGSFLASLFSDGHSINPAHHSASNGSHHGPHDGGHHGGEAGHHGGDFGGGGHH